MALDPTAKPPARPGNTTKGCDDCVLPADVLFAGLARATAALSAGLPQRSQWLSPSIVSRARRGRSKNT
eukprot:8920920-Alexandrium_andersonii.AAC.1